MATKPALRLFNPDSLPVRRTRPAAEPAQAPLSPEELEFRRQFIERCRANPDCRPETLQAIRGALGLDELKVMG